MDTSDAPQPLVARRAPPLSGRLRVPGDKSISHRALMLGGLALGRSDITGLLEGDDVLATARAMAALGAGIERHPRPPPQGPDHGVGAGSAAEGPLWVVHGLGCGGLLEPETVLDLGNAGTGVRLLMGLLATHDLTAVLTGDASLRRRPMGRVTTPLALFGARFMGRCQGRLPLAIQGATNPVPVTYRLPVASAQVKSAVLLAGLNTPGETRVIEPVPTRDHTERLFAHFGLTLRREEDEDGAPIIVLPGQQDLRAGRPLRIPADPSSAAFPLVAALLVPDSHVILTGVGLNPARTGLFDTLREMGADIRILNPREEAGEPVGDLEVRASRLTGVRVPAERAPSMIDEYPILAVAAACARGSTRMEGLAELRVKESDRLAAMERGLVACGVAARIEGDDLIVEGGHRPPRGGVAVAVHLDHRIGMSFLVLGLVADEPIGIDDARAIDTSFPGFAAAMQTLGAPITRPDEPASPTPSPPTSAAGTE